MSSDNHDHASSDDHVDTSSDNPLDSITGKNKLDTSDPVQVYFYQQGDLYDHAYYARTHTDYEITQLWSVFEHLETFIDVDFQLTTDKDSADLQFGIIDGRAENSVVVHGIPLGRGFINGLFNFPDGNGNGNEGALNMFGLYGWSDKPGGQFDEGGTYYQLALHEVGHGVGLGHPHDIGNSSKIMDQSYGLDQSIYTVMSYNDESWSGRSDNPGNYSAISTYGALDIAALQNMYGANTTHAAGDDVYSLAATRAAARGYQTIWDTGGTDSMEYTGDADAVIDLRAATLEYEQGGGGFVSWVWNIPGGYTIAHGVVIENATSGNGDDRLTGNEADNVLDAGAGDDTLIGNAGDDTLIGAAGNDVMTGGAGADRFVFDDPKESGKTARTVIDGSAADDRLKGTAGADSITGLGGDDRIEGLGDNDHISGNTGADILYGNAGNDRLWGDKHADTLYGGVGDDRLFGGKGGDSLYGGKGADKLWGNAGNDELHGGEGKDRLQGGEGKDILYGGNGADRFVYEQPGFGRDRIGDFEDGTDILKLHNLQWDDLTIADNGRGDTVVSVNGTDDAIILKGVAVALVGEDDFVFVNQDAEEEELVFTGPGFGQDRITDFEDGTDVLDFSELDLEWADLTVSENDNGYAVIQVTGTDSQVTLTGVDVTLISADDFIF